MSFHVVRYEHPDIFVVNRQTYETYRFTVGDDGAFAHDGPLSDLGEARRVAVAFLAQSRKESASGHEARGLAATPPFALPPAAPRRRVR